MLMNARRHPPAVVTSGNASLSHLLRTLAGAMLLFPDTCVICGRQGRCPCPACAMRLPSPPSLPLPCGLDSLAVVMSYELAGRRLITSLKYRNRRGILQWLADEMASRLQADAPEVVTWIPASVQGKRRRGFDTGALLAARIGHRLGLPVQPLLRRTPGPAQTLRSAAERTAGPPLSLVRSLLHRPPFSVCLVDDVCTTGASIETAAHALRAAGVVHVVGAVAARTPLHRLPTA